MKEKIEERERIDRATKTEKEGDKERQRNKVAQIKRETERS